MIQKGTAVVQGQRRGCQHQRRLKMDYARRRRCCQNMLKHVFLRLRFYQNSCCCAFDRTFRVHFSFSLVISINWTGIAPLNNVRNINKNLRTTSTSSFRGCFKWYSEWPDMRFIKIHGLKYFVAPSIIPRLCHGGRLAALFWCGDLVILSYTSYVAIIGFLHYHQSMI